MSDRVVPVGSATIESAVPAPLRAGAMRVRSRESATVRVHTEAGLVGEARSLTPEAPVASVVDRLVTPHTIAPEARDLPLRERFRGANVLVRRRRLAARALGLVEVALWDIGAQRECVPSTPALELADRRGRTGRRSRRSRPFDPGHRVSSGRLAVTDGLAEPPSGPGIGFELLEVAP